MTRLALQALPETIEEPREDESAPERVREVLAKVRARIDGQGLTLEQDLLASVRRALPARAPSFWDMTILAYWVWSASDPGGANTMHSAQGSGGLRYAFPVAFGAAVADPRSPVLAVSGDGGALYSITELATARQYDLNVTWPIVDDGGYGILREYMTDAFGEATGTELSRPGYVALAESFGVPGVRTSPATLAKDLAKALAAPTPVGGGAPGGPAHVRVHAHSGGGVGPPGVLAPGGPSVWRWPVSAGSCRTGRSCRGPTGP